MYIMNFLSLSPSGSLRLRHHHETYMMFASAVVTYAVDRVIDRQIEDGWKDLCQIVVKKKIL